MKKIMIVIISFFTIANAFAGQGCDALKVFVYNLSDKMIYAFISEEDVGLFAQPSKGIAPGKLIEMGLATTSLRDSSFSSVAYVRLFSDNDQIAYLGAGKAPTYAPRPDLDNPRMPELLKPKEHGEDSQKFSIFHKFSQGSCSKWIPGTWVIAVAPPLP